MQGAKDEKRVYVILAKQLKTLLRECVSFYDPYERKILIERTYNWYRDKRRVLLEFTTRRNEQNREDELGMKGMQRQKEDAAMMTDTDKSKNISGVAMDSWWSLSPRQQPFDHRETGLDSLYRMIPHTDTDNKMSGKEQHRQNFDDDVPYYANPEKKRAVFIKTKLKHYARRNLEVSELKRAQMMDRPVSQPLKNVLSGQFSRPHTAPATWISSAEQPSDFRYAHTLTDDISSTGADDMSSHHTDEELRSKRSGYIISSTFEHDDEDDPMAIAKTHVRPFPMYKYFKKPRDQSEVNVERRWLSHRAQEAQEKIELDRFRDIVTSWTRNRTRIEEEIMRRQESMRYSSQTGSRVHRIVRHVNAKDEQARQLHMKRQIQLHMDNENYLDSSDEDDIERDDEIVSNNDENDDADWFSMRSVDGSGYHWMGSNAVKKLRPMSSSSITSSMEIMLSPYINLTAQSSHHNNEDVEESVSHAPNILTLSSLRSRPGTAKMVKAMISMNGDDIEGDNQRIASSFGLRRPQTSEHSLRNIEFDGLEAIGPRLPRGTSRNSMSSRPKSTTTADRLLKRNVFLSPVSTRPNTTDGNRHHGPVGMFKDEKIVMHDVFEIAREERKQKALEEEMLRIKQAKKAALEKNKGQKTTGRRNVPAAKKGKDTKKKKDAATETAKEPESRALNTPSSSIAFLPPSEFRTQQLDQVERIQMMLSKQGVDIPQSVIEKNVLIPEDMPYSHCIGSLPNPSDRYLVDYSAATKKKKKKTKKGSKKRSTKKKKTVKKK